MAKEKAKIGLLGKLTFAKEDRADGKISEPIDAGRFRYFRDVYKRRSGSLMTANLFLIISLLPFLAVFAALSFFGAEKLSYMLLKVGDIPYLMSGVGFGISEAAAYADVRVDMLSVYYLVFLVAGATLIPLCLGLAGMMPVCMKFVWGDTLICKKDSYGNDVPRIVPEYFLGIKKYWRQMLVAGLFMFVLFAGVGDIFVFFLSRHWAGKAGAGEWILILLASAAAVIGAMFIIFLLPAIVMYDINFAKKMKNAIILTFQMFPQNFFVLAAIVLPFVLIGVTKGFISIVLIALLLVFGGPVYCLAISNYSQYYAEKIITPVYKAQLGKSKRNKKKSKK